MQLRTEVLRPGIYPSTSVGASYSSLCTGQRRAASFSRTHEFLLLNLTARPTKAIARRSDSEHDQRLAGTLRQALISPKFEARRERNSRKRRLWNLEVVRLIIQ